MRIIIPAGTPRARRGNRATTRQPPSRRSTSGLSVRSATPATITTSSRSTRMSRCRTTRLLSPSTLTYPVSMWDIQLPCIIIMQHTRISLAPLSFMLSAASYLRHGLGDLELAARCGSLVLEERFLWSRWICVPLGEWLRVNCIENCGASAMEIAVYTVS